MLITNLKYLDALRTLKQAYANLPWYQRAWFFIWSYNLHSLLSAINPDNSPVSEQIQALYEQSQRSWFFQTIFGLLERFQQAVANLPYHAPSNFMQVPADVLNHKIADDLTTKELINLVQSSKEQKALFQPVLDVRQFLHHVTRVNYDEIERMLRKDSTLLTKKGKVTDCSGRTFAKISGFEYTLWALDKHMWTRMLACLSNNEQDKEIRTTLAAQYKGVKEMGITYSENGKQIPAPEHHFDFKNTIIKELQTQVDAAAAPNPNWVTIDRQWIEGVGGSQNKLPMHVIEEYFSERPSPPTPAFTTQPRLNKSFNYNKWFRDQLGSHYAICRDQVITRRLRTIRGGMILLAQDLIDMKALYTIRTNDFNELGTQLGHPAVDGLSVVPHM